MLHLRDLLATKPACILLALAFLTTQTWIAVTLGKTGHKVGYLQTVCMLHPSAEATGKAARESLLEWTEQDIYNFRRHYILDTWIHPLVYALALTSAAMYDLKRRNHPQFVFYGRIAALLCFTAGLFDVRENLYHRSIEFEPELVAPDDVLFPACVYASAKWIIVAPIFCVLLWRYLIMAPPQATTKKD